jgi:hypothetical protein
MIILERVTSEDFPGQVWTDESNTHVIVEEVGPAPHGYGDAGFYVRDAVASSVAYATFDEAFAAAQSVWGPVALGPALRLERDVAQGRAGDVAQYLLEYLAEYGAAGIDVRDLAENVLTLQEG